MSEHLENNLPNQLVFDNANQVLSLLSDAEGTCVDIDLSQVVHCDSAGIGALILAKSIYQKQGRIIKYNRPPAQLLDLSRFMKVENLLFS